MSKNIQLDYWKECISIAADECGAAMTDEQLDRIADSAMSGHENYGMAFYSPPASDRTAEIKREHDKKVAILQREFDEYRANAERAVKIALRQRDDTQLTIERDGEVFRHGGRTERIQ